MLRSLALGLLSLGYLTVASAQQADTPEATIEKFSYAMGYRMAKDLIRQNISVVDPTSLAAGVNDSLQGNPFALAGVDMQKVIEAYQNLMLQVSVIRAEENTKEGKDFMLANKDKDGVKVFENGIQYKILTEGTGPTPKADDDVKVHYVGRLLDGEVFDSSRQRDKPAEFNLSGVIKGWTETLKQMPTGSRWLVWIPPELAYGPSSPGGKIGPNQTLEFEIELLEVLKKK